MVSSILDLCSHHRNQSWCPDLNKLEVSIEAFSYTPKHWLHIASGWLKNYAMRPEYYTVDALFYSSMIWPLFFLEPFRKPGFFPGLAWAKVPTPHPSDLFLWEIKLRLFLNWNILGSNVLCWEQSFIGWRGMGYVLYWENDRANTDTPIRSKI